MGRSGPASLEWQVSGWRAVAAGDNPSLALRSDSTV